MAKYNRKNRAIVSGILVGVASIYAIAAHFDMGMNQLSGFMVSTLVFFLAIVVLAALTVMIFKFLAKLLHPNTNAAHKTDAESGEAHSGENNKT